MNSKELIGTYWSATMEQNREALHDCFHESAQIYLHDTNELLDSKSLIDFNCASQIDYKMTVDRINLLDNGQIITITFWQSPEWNGFITSFFTLQDEKIIRMDEYYAQCDELPQWRTDLRKYE
jgi:hypothetical protein